MLAANILLGTRKVPEKKKKRKVPEKWNYNKQVL